MPARPPEFSHEVGQLNDLLQAFSQAFHLIITLDPEMLDITGRTLMISLSSCIIATLFFLPLGSLIHFNRFPGKRILVNLIQTFYSIPTVVVGLLMFIIFSRLGGPLGFLNLVYTPTIMIVGQVVLISPIILGLVIAALNGVESGVFETAASLGADRAQATFQVIKEARYSIMSAITLGFGRAISEVGLALMIGGNIKGYTRVITTAVALETSKGNVPLSLALGIILIFMALIVNIIFNKLQQK
jgi:tungstate transport system permease protein